MTRRMLISGHQAEELRIAIMSDDVLEEYQFEVADDGLTRGNIYRARIARLEESLNAAFIDYGAGRDGFLAAKDVVAEARYRAGKGRGREGIAQMLEAGQPIVVEVTRDPEGRKGAVLTTNLSLPGRYLVLTPFDATRGISRKVDDDETRSTLKKLAAELELPEGCGVVVRTNARDQTRRELHRDLAALLRLWHRIREEAMSGRGIRLLYSDQDLILRMFRDYVDASLDEIVVDDAESLPKVERYLQAFLPRAKVQVSRWEGKIPLFAHFGLEQQVESIYRRNVALRSGGSIVIDSAEALTAIDVNSGSATQQKSQEETAVRINLEAAAEVARQLRLRDIGGLVVVDFIDMDKQANRRKVEKELRDALKMDKARTQVSKISSNGLLEINRQRLRQPLAARRFVECPTCRGRGRLPSPELASLQLVRRLEARAAGGAMKSVVVRLHPQNADALQNLRRRELSRIESETGIKIEIRATSLLERLDEDIQWTALSREERLARAEETSTTSVEAEAAKTVPVAGATTAPSPATPPAAAEDGGEEPQPAEDEGEAPMPAEPSAAAASPEASEEREETRAEGEGGSAPRSRPRGRRGRGRRGRGRRGRGRGGAGTQPAADGGGDSSSP